MAEKTRIRVKLGPHEFDANGSTDAITNAYKAFLEAVRRRVDKKEKEKR